jgi:hypothetical protein
MVMTQGSSEDEFRDFWLRVRNNVDATPSPEGKVHVLTRSCEEFGLMVGQYLDLLRRGEPGDDPVQD